MNYILIAIYVMVIPGYSAMGEQKIPVRLGNFKTLEACQIAAKEVSPRLRGGSYVMCAPTDTSKPPK